MSKFTEFTEELAKLEIDISEANQAVTEIHTAGKVDAASLAKLGQLNTKLTIYTTRKNWLLAKLPFAKLGELRDRLHELEIVRKEKSAIHKTAKVEMIEQLKPLFGHNNAYTLAMVADLTTSVKEKADQLSLAISQETSAQRAAYNQADSMSIRKGWDTVDLGI